MNNPETQAALRNEQYRDIGSIGHNAYKGNEQTKNTTHEAKQDEQYKSTKITGVTWDARKGYMLAVPFSNKKLCLNLTL